jgi:hypothetical protein
MPSILNKMGEIPSAVSTEAGTVAARAGTAAARVRSENFMMELNKRVE